MPEPKRLYESGALVTYHHDEPGFVTVRLTYDRPGLSTRMHTHVFDHSMECEAGAARVEIDGVATILRAGDKYLVEAHKAHDVLPLSTGTILACRHEIRKANGERDPTAFAPDGIPLEWLDRLTERVAA